MEKKEGIIINYQGKEVRKEQLHCSLGANGEVIYELPRKNCKLIFNSKGEKRVFAMADQYGRISHLGTYGADVKLQNVDIVAFKNGYMSRYNGVSVVDTTGIRYEVPKFDYFENELVTEDMGEAMPVVLETEETPEEVKAPETEYESMVETPEEPVIEPETEDRNALIAKSIAEFRMRSGLTD